MKVDKGRSVNALEDKEEREGERHYPMSDVPFILRFPVCYSISLFNISFGFL